MANHRVVVKDGYEIVFGDKGQMQIRFWPSIHPILGDRLNEIIFAEFGLVNPSKLLFKAGIVNFSVELMPEDAKQTP